MKLAFEFSRSKPVRREKAVVATSDLRTGWEAYGIPADAGDGFAYNAEGRLFDRRAVTEQSILQLSAAMACVRLLSQTIATLPIGIYRRLGDGSRKATPDHPLYEILHNQPNADMSAVDFWQVMLAALLLRGNAVSERLMIGDRLVGLEPLLPSRLSWIRLPNGQLEYSYADSTGRFRKLSAAQVWHIPAFTLDGIVGISPICFGAGVFSGAQAADEASRNVFENGMAASGFVSFGKDSNAWLKESQRDQLRDNIANFTHRGAKNGGVFVLEGGMGYTQLAMNPEDAQMLETRSFNVEEICRWFGVPPTLIGHGDKTSNWGTGLEQQNLSFLTYHLRPWLSKIEQSIRKSLLSQADKGRYFAEFSVEGLLRADTAGRASFYSTMVNNGMKTRDECRALENDPPMGGNAAVLTVQSALIPLDKLGEKPAAPAAPAVPAEDPPNVP